jgi:hypothetical protein
MQRLKSIHGEKSWKRSRSRAMQSESALLSNEAVARRLMALRYSVAGDNQTRFASQIGIGIKSWNNSERTGNISRSTAIMLCEKFPGLTLDWLYRGREDGLSVARQRSLHEAEINLTSADLRG